MRAVIQFDGPVSTCVTSLAQNGGPSGNTLYLWLDESWGESLGFRGPGLRACVCLPQCPTILLASVRESPNISDLPVSEARPTFFSRHPVCWHLAPGLGRKKEWKCRTPSPSPAHTSDTSFPVISVSHQRSGLIRSANNT